MLASRIARNAFLALGLMMVLGIVPAVAQDISGIDGTIEHGASLTILGQGFGQRDINNNLIYDNLESGSFHSRWAETGHLDIVSESRHPNSAYSAHNNFRNWRSHGYFTGGSNDPGPWFIQYWFKLDENFDWGTGMVEGQPGATLANVKFFRMWETGNSWENYTMAVHGWTGGGAAAVEYTDQPVAYMAGGYQQSWTKGEWHLFQFEWKENSALGARDGIVRWWIDGQLVWQKTDWMTREDETPYKRPFIVGFFDSWGDPYADDNDFYLDDVYIDDSWARVELGNASTYSACTHREIQKPVAWSDSAVEVVFNAGAFQPGQKAYLFTINPNGQPSEGFEVTIGGTVEPRPGQPGKPLF